MNAMIRSIFILTFLIFTLISCKKDFTCSCMQTNVTSAYSEYGNYYPETTTSETYSNSINSKKNESESNCKKSDGVSTETYGSGVSQRTVTATVVCEIK